jgi:hypothetical protein
LKTSLVRFPENLRELIDVQVARLKPGAQHLLEVASVLGSEFTVASVAAGLNEDTVAVEETASNWLSRNSSWRPRRSSRDPTAHRFTVPLHAQPDIQQS